MLITTKHRSSFNLGGTTYTVLQLPDYCSLLRIMRTLKHPSCSLHDELLNLQAQSSIFKIFELDSVCQRYDFYRPKRNFTSLGCLGCHSAWRHPHNLLMTTWRDNCLKVSKKMRSLWFELVHWLWHIYMQEHLCSMGSFYFMIFFCQKYNLRPLI